MTRPSDFQIRPIAARGYEFIRTFNPYGHAHPLMYQFGIHAVPNGGRVVMMDKDGFPLRAWLYSSRDFAARTMRLAKYPVVHYDNTYHTPELDWECVACWDYVYHPAKGYHWEKLPEHLIER